jgi:hypothetical protein
VQNFVRMIDNLVITSDININRVILFGLQLWRIVVVNCNSTGSLQLRKRVRAPVELEMYETLQFAER